MTIIYIPTLWNDAMLDIINPDIPNIFMFIGQVYILVIVVISQAASCNLSLSLVLNINLISMK